MAEVPQKRDPAEHDDLARLVDGRQKRKKMDVRWRSPHPTRRPRIKSEGLGRPLPQAGEAYGWITPTSTALRRIRSSPDYRSSSADSPDERCGNRGSSC